MSLFSAILPWETDGVKFAKLQRALREIADAAGIVYNIGGYLSDIRPRDTQGTKWAKLDAWTKEIANNIGGGGGVTSVNGQTGVVVLDAADVGASPANMGQIIYKQGGGIALVTTVAKTLVYLDLPAGVWEVSAPYIDIAAAGDAQASYVEASISTTDNTMDYTQNYNAVAFDTPMPLAEFSVMQPSAILTLAVPTRVYVVAGSTFAGVSPSGYANIQARLIPSVTVQP